MCCCPLCLDCSRSSVGTVSCFPGVVVSLVASVLLSSVVLIAAGLVLVTVGTVSSLPGVVMSLVASVLLSSVILTAADLLLALLAVSLVLWCP